MSFELSNEQRKYLGLELIGQNWEKVILKGDSYRPNSILYFSENTIRKQVISTDSKYSEIQFNEETKDRELLLPKTKKGKPKKLSSSNLEARTPIGVYFEFNNNGITIGNHSTQNTYYSTYFEDIKFQNISDLKNWLTDFIKNSSKSDLVEIEKFASKKRKRIKLKEGDFFTFKVDRRNYGFGRLVSDLRPLKKDPTFKLNKNYGIMNLMTQPLVIKIYHLISSTKEVDLDKLKSLNSIPAQYIMDNLLFYGDYEIIGNQPLTEFEYDFPISYSKSIHYGDFDTVYLQYGLIYKETSIKKFNKYLVIENPDKNAKSWEKILETNPYRMEGISSSLDFTKKELEDCISLKSNKPYWESEYYGRNFDLRNPQNYNIKKDIFNFFKLNPDKSYYENLNK